MKKIMLVFTALLICFCAVWVLKFNTPVNRPEDETPDTNKSDYWRDPDVPEADPDWILDPEIPSNYIPVPGEDELYMVVDKDGKITEYRHREKQEDGSWLWETVNPDIPDNYEPVEGLKDVYKVTDKDGKVRYFKYIRNDDDTFAFVEVDKDGNELPPEKPEDTSHKIPDNYVRVKGNVYAVYNEHNVCIGYKERRQDENGKYYWVDVDKPAEDTKPSKPDNPNPPVTTPTIEVPDITNPPDNPPPTTPGVDTDPDTYTQVETVTSTEIKGDWRITYRTTITRVYTRDGVLISTKKDGPHEVSREKLADSSGNEPDPSKIAATLQAEYARVSVGLAYRQDLAEEVIAILNVERVAAGLPAMRLDDTVDGQVIANIRAADMAIYSHYDYDSPMYGTVTDMCNKFKVKNKGTSEVVWRTTATKSAEDIASRLQIMHADLFKTEGYSSIGLSVVQKGGYLYVDFILIK